LIFWCSVPPAINFRLYGFVRPFFGGKEGKKREDNGESCQWESRKIRSSFRADVSSAIVITTANSAQCSGARPVRPGKSKNTVNFPASLRVEGGACIFVETSAVTVTACQPKKTLWWRCGGRTPERGRSRFKTEANACRFFRRWNNRVIFTPHTLTTI
jgi:hypothetical protein